MKTNRSNPNAMAAMMIGGVRQGFGCEEMLIRSVAGAIVRKSLRKIMSTNRSGVRGLWLVSKKPATRRSITLPVGLGGESELCCRSGVDLAYDG